MIKLMHDYYSLYSICYNVIVRPVRRGGFRGFHELPFCADIELKKCSSLTQGNQIKFYNNTDHEVLRCISK